MAKKEERMSKKTLKEDAAAENQGSIAAKPTDRMSNMAQAINLIGMMPDDMARNFLDQAMAAIGTEAQNIPDDAAARNQATIQTKTGIQEAIAAIFGGDKNLSEKFGAEVGTLFEAALSARLGIERAALQEELEAQAEEELETLVEGLTAQVDQYLTYVAEEWIGENQVQIEGTLKSEIAESLLEGLKDVFESHYIDIPESKIDVVDELAARLEEAEGKLNDVMAENMQLVDIAVAYEKAAVIDEAAQGLTLTDKDKFRALTEDLDFDPETFEAKLVTIKESHFGVKKVGQTNLLTEELNEVTETPRVLDPVMNSYVNAARKLATK